MTDAQEAETVGLTTTRPRRWGRSIVLAVLGSGFLTPFAAALALSTRWSGPVVEFEPKALRGVATTLRLVSRDGIEFGGSYAAGRPGGPAVVLVHGNGGDRAQLADEWTALHDAGAHVLSITVRAHGDSEGMRNDFGFSARFDVMRAVEFLRTRHPEARLVVYGHSLGAAAALFAAGPLDDTVDALVLSAPYATLDAAVRRRTERYLPEPLDRLAYLGLRLASPVVLPAYDVIRPVEAARAVSPHAELLVMVGSSDDRAPPSDARAVVEAAAHGRVEVFEGASHESLFLRDPARWRALVMPAVFGLE